MRGRTGRTIVGAVFGAPALVLVALLEHGKLDMTRLERVSGLSRQSVYTAVDKLLKLSLIAEEYEDRPPNRRFVYLTETGRRLAEALKPALRLAEQLQQTPTEQP